MTDRTTNGPTINGPAAIWGAPLAVAAVIAAGLAAALLLEGTIARASVCVALAVPLAIIGYFVARAGRRSRQP